MQGAVSLYPALAVWDEGRGAPTPPDGHVYPNAPQRVVGAVADNFAQTSEFLGVASTLS